ncbi:putative bifunctional diguanylate cyclase/phosphodiesterase, partial [Silvibacterium sp.]|uniref:putative bifunctional diguanylate cyclase/phosphodiesterase n=1 Tax=Silvibacterium sp. TaxID=1964179 RepID=UPI0039E69E6D
PDESDRGTLARMGGDEFVVLLEELQDTSEAARVAQRLQDTLAESFCIGGSQLFVSASIGIASSDSHYHRAEDMLRDADMAMYRAKACGKAQYQVFDARMHLQAVRRLSLEQNLRVAFERKQFLLYYMPIITLATGAVSGFEALVRWERPGEGIIAPGEFIGLAEETGLIVPIGDWILREACRTLTRWQSTIPGCVDLTMNVNLSPRQFAHPALVDDVRRALAETGADPHLLRLEITESCTMENSERAIEVLTQLRSLGTQLSLDDFGTGFSSLSYLHRFPLQNLKIDRSFVSRMVEDSESLAIIRTIIRLARDLRLQVTAEGTDNPAQIRTLEALGCDFAQGFYYSPPLPEIRAEAYLRSHREHLSAEQAAASVNAS